MLLEEAREIFSLSAICLFLPLILNFSRLIYEAALELRVLVCQQINMCQIHTGVPRNPPNQALNGTNTSGDAGWETDSLDSLSFVVENELVAL